MDMRTTKVILAVLALSTGLGGCASQNVRLEIHSLPEGAAVIQDGRVMGTTPTVIEYPGALLKSAQCAPIRPLSVQWTSGATSTWSGELCPSVGYNQQYTFLRPADVAGGEIDARVAAGQQQARAIQAAAQAVAEAQVEAANTDALNEAAGQVGYLLGGGTTVPLSAPPITPYQANKKVTCTTRANGDFGNTVTTTCN